MKIIILLLAMSSVYANDFYTQHQDGWFWYQDKRLTLQNSTQAPIITPAEQVDLGLVQK